MSSLSPDHRRAIVLLSVAAAASAASARVCDPMLPELGRTFAATPTETAYAVSGFAVAYGLIQAFFGPVGDRIGKFRLIALTTLAATLGSIGAALAGGLDRLVLARVLTGAAAAGIIPLSMAWIGDTVPYERRQATLARFLIGQILGLIGGQFVGGAFTDWLGWRWAFAFLCLVYLGVGALLLREYGRNPVARANTATARHGGVIAQAAKVLRLGWARTLLAIVFLEGAAVFGPLAFLPSDLHQRFGLELTEASALVALFGLGGLSYIAFADFFVRRLGEAGLALAGGLEIAAAWTMMAGGGAWQWALPAAWLVGLGFYMLHNTLQINATQMAPEMRGTAVSLFASAFFLGQSAGVSLAAMVLHQTGAAAMFGAAAVTIPLLGSGFAVLLKRRS